MGSGQQSGPTRWVDDVVWIAIAVFAFSVISAMVIGVEIPVL